MKSLRPIRFRFVLTLSFLLCLPTLPKAEVTGFALRRANPIGQSLAIVVNRLNPTEDLSFAELRKIFMGERSHWVHGRRIAVAMMAEGQPERDTVLRKIYHMSEDGYREHFLRGLFTGDVFLSPKTLSGPVVVRKFVFNAPGAIGYLRAGDVDESVKVLRIDGHLPNDKDYRIQIDARPNKRDE